MKPGAKRRTKAEILELQEKVIRMMSMGMTFLQISKKLEISTKYAWELYKKVKEQRLQLATEDYATIISNGYDEVAKSALDLYVEATQKKEIKNALAALKLYNDALKNKAELFGANKPQKFSWTNPEGDQSGELKIIFDFQE
ncbi:MAG: hypothetical protein KGZ97_09735 [Bacteroidetes bacterium]|nr:hypothetical protein [Bacteroidota bacterium]